jgi:hypothetical protein
MKLFKSDFIRPFLMGFVGASALVLGVMHHAPTTVSQSLLPSAQAASVDGR